MEMKIIFEYVCACVLVLAYLHGGNSEVSAEVSNSEHILQAREVEIIQENVQEVFDNDVLEEEHDDLSTRCPVPEPPKNGAIVGELTHIGSVLLVKCRDGYRLKGHAVITCERIKNGASWNPDVPRVCIENNDHQQPQTEVSTETEEASELRHSENNYIISPLSFDPRNQPKSAWRKTIHHEEHAETESPTKPEAENTSKLPESCLLEPAAGPCGASIQRYYFNKATMECYKFIYGGCDGNSNNFETITHCNLACLGYE